ncbi:hypothetical protein [Actinokineospora sp. HUAS TT18]|uniref:hypothetical protein n=1 Tax=Actinokineospora sp. HUAS TT18 TaxID=3447451 RepID=UPI003F5206EE
MPAASVMSSLLETVATERHRLRGEDVTSRFLGTISEGIAVWETAVAGFDAGGEAGQALAVVTDAFVLSEDTATAARVAEDVVRMGVAKPLDVLVVGLVQVHRELVKDNRRPVAMVRKAAAMERRATSRWRGAEGRRGQLVDRDLQLEEARLAAREVVADARRVADLLVRWRSQPVP